MTPERPIVVAGAGAIGCFVGGLLADRGHAVTLLGRPRVLNDISAHGLRLTDFGGMDRRVPKDALTLTDDAACLAKAGVVLATVKTADTAIIAAEIARHAPPDAIIISLQNGMEAVEILRRSLPLFDVRAGMVPFNVVPQASAVFHRATSGDIVIGAGSPSLAGLLSMPDLTVTESDRIVDVQWGKLLINLNNALNALSGMTLYAQLLDRGWRHLMADQMTEALAVLRAHDIRPAPTTPLPVALVPWVLRLPTPVFSRVASRMLTIDPKARTSMSYDLEAGKPTEIDALQGLIVEMGQAKAIPIPICARVADRIRQARGLPELTPADLR